LVLVQAVPYWGAEQLLYLNVQAVLILKPFKVFGRRLIDLQSPCPRKTFLTVTKGVGRNRGSMSGTQWGSIGGKIAHQVVERFAVEKSLNAADDEMLRSALRGDTLFELVCLGLSTPDDMTAAINKGRDAARTVRDDVQIRELLEGGDWRVES